MSALSTLFKQFLRERRYLKNVTPKTVIWYENAFDALTRSVAVSAPNDLTKPVLQEFVVRLRERGLSPVSCNTYIKAINAVLAWLHAEGHLSTKLSLPPQRTEKRVVQTFSDDQLRRLRSLSAVAFRSGWWRDLRVPRRRDADLDAPSARFLPSRLRLSETCPCVKQPDGSEFRTSLQRALARIPAQSTL